MLCSFLFCVAEFFRVTKGEVEACLVSFECRCIGIEGDAASLEIVVGSGAVCLHSVPFYMPVLSIVSSYAPFIRKERDTVVVFYATLFVSFWTNVLSRARARYNSAWVCDNVKRHIVHGTMDVLHASFFFGITHVCIDLKSVEVTR